MARVGGVVQVLPVVRREGSMTTEKALHEEWGIGDWGFGDILAKGGEHGAPRD